MARPHLPDQHTTILLHPFAPPEIFGVFSYEVEGVQFLLSRPVQTVSIDRPWGEQRRLLTVAPAINIAISPRVGVVPIAAAQLRSTLRSPCRTTSKAMRQAKSNCDCQTVGLQRQPSTTSHSRTKAKRATLFKVSLPHAATGADYKMHAVAEYGGREYTEGYRVIAHRDLEPRHLYRPATMDVRGIDVKVAPNLSVGYVMGVGDEVPKSLEQIGVKVTMLGENDLANGHLDQFDAIIIGIRASAVRDDLKTYSKRLLDYAERGGNLIYQYQTQEFDAAPYGPYPTS